MSKSKLCASINVRFISVHVFRAKCQKLAKNLSHCFALLDGKMHLLCSTQKQNKTQNIILAPRWSAMGLAPRDEDAYTFCMTYKYSFKTISVLTWCKASVTVVCYTLASRIKLINELCMQLSWLG